LDQLRGFVTVAEEGSFSAAARKLKRVQSAVSTSMSNLEEELGVPIWDRSNKAVQLSESGRAVLGAARRVLAEVDGLKLLAAGMAHGIEASVSLCLDAFFPLGALIDLCTGFNQAFPAVDLRVDTQVMSAVLARVRDGTATLGVVSPLGLGPGVEAHALTTIRMVPVVGSGHPLAAHRGRIPSKTFADAIQIVLSERVESGVLDQGVLSTRSWRVGDLHTKHALLRAGLGWGNMPYHLVRDDVQRGKLVVIRPAAWGKDQHTLHLTAIHRSDTVFGPAHRWLLAELGVLCARDAGPSARPRSLR
jgi:DNA-binding transcriptional LysR family regulator